MKTINQEQINVILEKHKLWLDGNGGERANLSRANLSGANLSRANLSDANLRRANLSDADLSDADLSDANLFDMIGNKREIKTLQTEKYTINFYGDLIQVGCKKYKASQWENFTDDKIADMDGGALEWWKLHRSFVLNSHKLLTK